MLDLLHLGSSPLLQSLDHPGLSFSVASMMRLDLPLPVLDFISLNFLFLLRGLSQLDFSPPVLDPTKIGSTLPLHATGRFDPTFPTFNLARADPPIFTLDLGRPGSPFFTRSLARCGPFLLLLGVTRLGFPSFVSDFGLAEFSPFLRSFG